MKNLFAIAFSTVYLTLAVGVAKTTHYCMGRENKSAHFSFQVDPCICGKLLGASSGCCDDETVLVQVSEDQVMAGPLSLTLADLPIIAVFECLPDLSTVENNNICHVPEDYPPPPETKKYLKHRSLLMYES